MPPRATRRQQKRKQADLLGITDSVDAFGYVIRRRERKNIVIEGDSWVAYPSEWFLFGPESNISDWLGRFWRDADTNILCMGGNGDTAEEMLSGSQRNRMEKLLKSYGEQIHILVFSGGGNDVVGEDDLPPLLQKYQDGFSAKQCLNDAAMTKKLAVIKKSYLELIRLRDRYAPDCLIVTHTYDFAKPTGIGARFLWGVEVAGPWIKPYLDDAGIPEALHLDVVKLLLGKFKTLASELEADNERFEVVNTQGTLDPHNTADWINEIHPTPSGFRRVTEKIQARIAQFHPELSA